MTWPFVSPNLPVNRNVLAPCKGDREVVHTVHEAHRSSLRQHHGVRRGESLNGRYRLLRGASTRQAADAASGVTITFMR